MAPRITGVFGPPCNGIKCFLCVSLAKRSCFLRITIPGGGESLSSVFFHRWFGGLVECGGEKAAVVCYVFFVCLFALGTACFPWLILKGKLFLGGVDLHWRGGHLRCS